MVCRSKVKLIIWEDELKATDPYWRTATGSEGNLCQNTRSVETYNLMEQ